MIPARPRSAPHVALDFARNASMSGSASGVGAWRAHNTPQTHTNSINHSTCYAESHTKPHNDAATTTNAHNHSLLANVHATPEHNEVQMQHKQQLINSAEHIHNKPNSLHNTTQTLTCVLQSARLLRLADPQTYSISSKLPTKHPLPMWLATKTHFQLLTLTSQMTSCNPAFSLFCLCF